MLRRSSSLCNSFVDGSDYLKDNRAGRVIVVPLGNGDGA